MHNIYLKSLEDKRMCDKSIQELIECYKVFSPEKESHILQKINKYCYKVCSNNASCSSVNSCGVTLK